MRKSSTHYTRFYMFNNINMMVTTIHSDFFKSRHSFSPQMRSLFYSGLSRDFVYFRRRARLTFCLALCLLPPSCRVSGFSLLRLAVAGRASACCFARSPPLPVFAVPSFLDARTGQPAAVRTRQSPLATHSRGARVQGEWHVHGASRRVACRRVALP